ncbi:MAG: glycosyltransferase [Acidobacteriota bacterium]|nr:glycosyltransferase [Acidobacteriota bacterium]
MRILFVAIGESVHTARWMNQIADEGWDLHLFQVEPGSPHKDFRNVTIHSFYRDHWNDTAAGIHNEGFYWPLPRGVARIFQVAQLIAPNHATQAARLARAIQSLKPDIVHVLEMQSAGYLTLEAKARLNGHSFPPCIFSCWGNDLYLFGKQPEHELRIRALLSDCDYYIADCARDLPLARQFGFKGEELGVFTTAGGYDLKRMRPFRQPGPTSSRKVIALKGHQTVRGANALAALKALETCRDIMSGFELRVFSASDEIRAALRKVSEIPGLRVTEVRPRCTHEEILDLMGSARIAIGISTSDGTPNAMLEAMVLGAFPIQSDTISTAEWIEDGVNGILVSATDSQSIADALRRALSDDELVDRAAKINNDLVEERLDLVKIKPQVIELYRKVAKQGKTPRV